MIGVLILIHEKILEALLVALSDQLIFLKKLEGKEKEVVEIHGIGLELFLAIAICHLGNFLRPFFEVRVANFEKFFESRSRIVDQRKDRDKNIRFGKTSLFRIDIALGDYGVHE